MKPNLCPKHSRIPRNRKLAVHWTDHTGTVCCRTPLASDSIAVRDVEKVTCAACLKVIEIQCAPDYMGNTKPPVPETRDWGPLFRATAILIGLILCACSSAPTFPGVDLPKAGTADAALSKPFLTTLLAKAASPSGIRGLVRMMPQRSSCRSRDGVLPYAYYRGGEPRVGKMLAIDWVSRACEPFPAEPMALLISLAPASPLDLSLFGHQGCWLLCGLTRPGTDFMVTPGPGSILTTDKPGRMSLRWTPGHEWTGATIYTQAIVMTQAGYNGWLVSPGLEIIVGSAM